MSQIQNLYNFIFEDHQASENSRNPCLFPCSDIIRCISSSVVYVWHIKPGIIHTISQSMLELSIAWPDHTRLTGAMHTEWIRKWSKLAWTRFKTIQFTDHLRLVRLKLAIILTSVKRSHIASRAATIIIFVNLVAIRAEACVKNGVFEV